MRLVFVHGSGQGGKDASKLRDTWVNALQEGYQAAGRTFPASLQVDFPFYGDVLDARVEQAQLPMPDAITPKGAGALSAYETFVRDALVEIQANAGISDVEVAKERGPLPATEKGIANWRTTQAVARLLDRRFPSLASYTIERFLRDVFLYVTHPKTAREINAIVDGMLPDAEPTVVVGHSLGSVVAYRALVERGTRMKLRRYVTVGSPLGITTITNHLAPLKYPAAAWVWYNAYNEGDVVALNPLSTAHFRTIPAIINYGRVQSGMDGQHGIIAYLNDPVVARAIDDALH